MSTGTDFAKMVRTNANMNTRTRDTRDHGSIKADILDAIQNAVIYPGYYNDERTELYSAAFAARSSWLKHVDGGRIDPILRAQLVNLTPWEFAGVLGSMIDAGVTNVGEGEAFFSAPATF